MSGGFPGSPLAGLTVYGCEPDEMALFAELAPAMGVMAAVTERALEPSTVLSVAGSRCASVGHTNPVGPEELRALRHVGVELLSTRSVGTDHIDMAAAADLGISVANVGYAPDGVADFTVLLVLMAIRQAPELLGPDTAEAWVLGGGRGRDLRDLTVGVVGVGRIGRAVIRRLRGFGCQVLACGNGRPVSSSVGQVPLDELLARSDVVTLHLPLDEGTHHVIGPDELGQMKPGAVLVNTGRGGLVDTAALVAALERGALSGAALDVVEGEEHLIGTGRAEAPCEPPPLAALRRMPNVILTPHVAYRTARTLRETVEGTLANCLDFERNRTDGQDQGRDRLRGVLGGARRVGEVGDGDRRARRHG